MGRAGAGLGIAAILLQVVGLDAARSVVASVDPRLIPLVLAVQTASTAALAGLPDHVRLAGRAPGLL